MTPTEGATLLANAISEGINCLAHLQSLRAESPSVSTADRDAWRETLAEMQGALETVRTGQHEGGQVVTSLRVCDELVGSIDNVRAQLSAVVPGEQLPSSLFDRVDVACAEFGKAGP